MFQQMEKKKQENKMRRDQLNDQYLGLLETQRLYFKTVKEFKEVRGRWGRALGLWGVVFISRRAFKNQSGCLVSHWAGDGQEQRDPTVRYGPHLGRSGLRGSLAQLKSRMF